MREVSEPRTWGNIGAENGGNIDGRHTGHHKVDEQRLERKENC